VTERAGRELSRLEDKILPLIYELGDWQRIRSHAAPGPGSGHGETHGS